MHRNGSLRLGIKHMPIFCCPDSGAVGSVALERLQEAEELLRGWTAAGEMRVRAWLEDDNRNLPADSRRRLEHRLSDIIEIMNIDRQRDRSSLHELELCRLHGPNTSNVGFSEMLFAIARCLPIACHSIRKITVRTRGDNYGNVVVYPEPSRIAGELDALATYVDVNCRHAPLLSAIVAYCGITAIHPFEDGNGRTARTVFNLILRASAAPCFFLPIFEIAGLSRGGLIIRQREAHYHARWEPIVDYFCEAIEAISTVSDE